MLQNIHTYRQKKEMVDSISRTGIGHRHFVISDYKLVITFALFTT